MDEQDIKELVNAMASLNPDIKTFDESDQGVEAITYAMSQVQQYDSFRWFGPIGNGTFWANDIEFQWFPETNPVEALGILGITLDESLTSGITY